MNYSQSANQNATNGEQDAKEIITHKELNPFQFDELVEQYVEIVLDRMNTDDLIEFVSDSLTNRFGSMEQTELKDYIIEMEHTFDNLDSGQELYDELVDNATSHIDPRLASLNTDRLPDISDNEAEGITE